MNLFDIIGGAIKQGFQNVPSALSQANQAYQNFRTDLPTNIATSQRYVQQAIAPKYSVPGFDQVRQNNRYGEEVYNQQTPKKRINYDFANEGIYMEPGAIKSGSAELQPMAVYPNDPRLSALKQASLDAMNLRPAMQRYLETIPVQQGNLENIIMNPDGTFSSAGGMAEGGNFQTLNPGGSWETNLNITPNPNILLERKLGINPEGWVNSALQHEYLHTTSPIRVQQARIGMAKLLENMPQNSPLRDAALQYYSDGRLPPNPEELFATLGEQYGQYVLMMPEIQEYYKNIFMQPTETENPISYTYNPQIAATGTGSFTVPAGVTPLKVPMKTVRKKK